MINKLKTNKFLLMIVVVLLLAITVTFGRFVYHELRDSLFGTERFYFESDKLTADHALYQIDNYNGVDQFDIVINMNSFKNIHVAANVDIEYEIDFSCSTKAICNVNKSDSIIYAASNTDYFIATIVPSEALFDEDEIWIEVSASAIAPYEKELSATFVLKVGHYGFSHEIVDEANSPYLELLITNTLDYYTVIEAFGSYSVGDPIDIETYLNLSIENQARCASAIVTLEFDPAEIILDMTNPAYINAISYDEENIGGFNYINFLEFKIDALSSTSVNFYKIDASNDYTYPIVNPTSIIDVSYD